METNHVGKAVRKLYDTKEAAEYLGGIKPNTLEGWRVKGVSPRFVKCGRLVRYKIEDLDAYLESRTRSSTSEVAA
jgi:excisionase family DNA binding protein